RAMVEGRPRTEVGRAAIASLLDVHPDGIYAVGQRSALRKREVRRRKAQTGAPPGAPGYDTGDAPPVAEVECRSPHVAGRELGADGARREYLARFRDRCDDGHREAMLPPGRPHDLRVAAAALAEKEVVADHHVADVQGAYEHLVNEP